MNNEPVLTKQHILSQIQEHRAQLQALGVRRLGLFGSYVRNEPTAESDVDVLVEFEPGQKTFDNFMRLAFLLEDVLGRPVEVVTAEALSPYLRPYITREVEYVPLVA
jgi:predicted nucleotidyltransferase